jgi:antitoxin component YwqK of YwqJK toxin-antitoxin module
MSRYPCSILIIFLLSIVLVSCRDVQKTYWPNGKLKSVVHLKGNIYHGKAQYYSSTGQIQLECAYQDNQLQGPLIRFYTFSRKKEEQHYSKGVLDGLSTTWYEDGWKLTETTYLNGVLNGPYREYHPENRIKVEGQYMNGYFSGRWLYYDFSGSVVGDGQFTHGTGIQRLFFPDGSQHRVVHYKDNLKDGEEIEYSERNKVVSIRIYHNDTLIRSLQR